ncbi:MAG TPA: c-type cytochrome [Burkholderiales bacterium]|nr:c-type cytochrome [Burkholderiales bacterium]
MAVITLASGAQAQEDLAKKHNCFACHAVDKKVVGPSYKDVAAKYRGDKNAPEKLFEKVKKGGAGVWGPVPMPPNAQVPDADIKALVHWILSLK